jgi:hypothetical protein
MKCRFRGRLRVLAEVIGRAAKRLANQIFDASSPKSIDTMLRVDLLV